MTKIDVNSIRNDFPILSRKMNGRPLVYLDNAATSQKPLSVIKRVSDFYTNEYATIHRGIYALSQEATVQTEDVRSKCREFLGAALPSEIIFVRGATEAINLVMRSFAAKHMEEGDEIVISELEHHANIVPWQRLSQEKKVMLRVAPIDDRGDIVLEEYKKLLNKRTRLVAVSHVSNVLGTVNPVKEIVALAHEAGALALIDGAQGAPHLAVDVQDIDCDFYCFSGHKCYGPTGSGVLYTKRKILNEMDPYQFGGDMIRTVSFDKTEFAEPPAKFEAGTPAIAEIVGLGTAIDYIGKIGWDTIQGHEDKLLDEANERLMKIPGLRIIGNAKKKSGAISFVLGDVHPHDIGTVLDQEGVAIRAGHHCAQPLMDRFKVPATARASFAFYNTSEDIAALIRALERVKKIFI